jgi:hypothetical protein
VIDVRAVFQQEHRDLSVDKMPRVHAYEALADFFAGILLYAKSLPVTAAPR